MEDKNQGMLLAGWWGENSYRFWLGEADGNELWEQGTAAAAAAAATATAQLFSIWQSGPWAATDESDSCVQASLENPRFSLLFVWHCFRVWKELHSPYILRTPFPLALTFPSVQDVASPDQHSVAGWHHAGGISAVSKQGWYWHPLSGAPKFLSWCRDAEKEPLRTPMLKPSCLHSLGRPASKEVQQPLCRASGFGWHT